MQKPVKYLCLALSPLRSRTIAALILYLLANVAIDIWRPLRSVALNKHPFLDQHSYDNKSAEWRRLTAAPDVLIIGSSLAMSAIGAADFAYMRKPYPIYQTADFTTYTGAKFLKDCAGLPLSYFSYACPGFIISHNADLLHESLQKGDPRLVVFMVGPRDLIDNLIQQIPLHSPDEEKPERKIGKYLRLYAVRGDLTALFRVYVRGCIDHWEKPLEGALYIRDIDTKLSHFDMYNDLATYSHRYVPLDWSRYHEQVKHLDRFLDLCQQHGIPVLLVNMPLPKDNISILEEGFYPQYMTMLKEKARRPQVTFLDLQALPYEDDDFRDAAHLRHTGAMKACRSIGLEIARILGAHGQ